MKVQTIHYTGIAFVMGAALMFLVQGAPTASEQQQPALSSSIEYRTHTIQPVSLPTVTRRVSEPTGQSRTQQTWTF